MREAQGDFCNELLSRAPAGKDGGVGAAARETQEASERFRWELMGWEEALGLGQRERAVLLPLRTFILFLFVCSGIMAE